MQYIMSQKMTSNSVGTGLVIKLLYKNDAKFKLRIWYSDKELENNYEEKYDIERKRKDIKKE